MGQLHLLEDFRPGKGGGPRRSQRAVYFNRSELTQLLSVYSRRVMTGEWRDYAIDHQPGIAMFSIFRHTHDQPLFSIAKRANGSSKPGKEFDYAVYSGRQQLARSGKLAEALRVFERKLQVVS
ncbi:MAG: DUF2794 domain-containing protein [Rhodovibrionaceae bacterium]